MASYYRDAQGKLQRTEENAPLPGRLLPRNAADVGQLAGSGVMGLLNALASLTRSPDQQQQLSQGDQQALSSQENLNTILNWLYNAEPGYQFPTPGTLPYTDAVQNMVSDRQTLPLQYQQLMNSKVVQQQAPQQFYQDIQNQTPYSTLLNQQTQPLQYALQNAGQLPGMAYHSLNNMLVGNPADKVGYGLNAGLDQQDAQSLGNAGQSNTATAYLPVDWGAYFSGGNPYPTVASQSQAAANTIPLGMPQALQYVQPNQGPQSYFSAQPPIPFNQLPTPRPLTSP